MSDTGSDSGSDFSDDSNFDFELLHEYVRRNNIKKVEKLIESSSFDASLDDDYPALLIAARSGYVKMARVLLDAGYYVDDITREWESAMREAIENDDLEMVKLFVDEYHADLKGGNGKYPIAMASAQGNIDIVTFLAQHKCDDNSFRDAAFEAAAAGHLDILQYLLSFEKCKVSNNIINVTARSGEDKVLAWLLTQDKYDPNFVNTKKETPLDNAVDRGHLECVKVLLNHNSIKVDTDHVMSAFKQKNKDIVVVLLPHIKLDDLLHLNDSDENTPLHLALQKGLDYDIIKKIMKLSPNMLNVFNSKGLSPFMIACKYGASIEVVKLLLGKSEIRAANVKGNTALLYAARAGRDDIVDLLLKKKVAVKRLHNVNGKTILHKAVKSGNFELLQLLDEYSLINNVDVKDNKGRTAVISCVSNLDMLKLLQAKGTILTNTDNSGNTILHNVCLYACKKSEDDVEETFKYILDNHPELKNIKNTDEESPKDIVKKNRYDLQTLYKTLKLY